MSHVFWLAGDDLLSASDWGLIPSLKGQRWKLPTPYSLYQSTCPKTERSVFFMKFYDQPRKNSCLSTNYYLKYNLEISFFYSILQIMVNDDTKYKKSVHKATNDRRNLTVMIYIGRIMYEYILISQRCIHLHTALIVTDRVKTQDSSALLHIVSKRNK